MPPQFYKRDQEEEKRRNKRDQAKATEIKKIIVAMLWEGTKSLQSGLGSRQ